MKVWATVRFKNFHKGFKATPCLWGTFDDASSGCDDDEKVVRVEVREIGPRRDPWDGPHGGKRRSSRSKTRSSRSSVSSVLLDQALKESIEKLKNSLTLSTHISKGLKGQRIRVRRPKRLSKRRKDRS